MRHCFEIVSYHTADGEVLCPACHRPEDDYEGGDYPIFLEKVYEDPQYVCSRCGGIFKFERLEWETE